MEQKLIHPPLKQRQAILDIYNQAVPRRGHDWAGQDYRRSMQELYERYNPWLAYKRKQREKQRGWSDDF